MVTRRGFLALLGSAGVAGSAAVIGSRALAGGADEGPRLPSIRYGEEMCTRCRMVIDDARFAAAWIDGPEEVHFDDIGCAALEASERQLAAIAQVFVHDFSAETWIDGRAASYVHASSIRTPMSYGVVAFGDHAAAQSLATKTGGRFLAWGDLAQQLEAQPAMSPSMPQPSMRQPDMQSEAQAASTHGGHG